MALKIRMRQQGRTNRQTFRVVVVDGRSKRDGKYLEMLGWYIPFQAENNFSVNAERVAYWLEKGAQISDQVKFLVEKAAPDVMKNYTEQMSARRTKRAAQRRGLKKAGEKVVEKAKAAAPKAKAAAKAPAKAKAVKK